LGCEIFENLLRGGRRIKKNWNHCTGATTSHSIINSDKTAYNNTTSYKLNNLSIKSTKKQLSAYTLEHFNSISNGNN